MPTFADPCATCDNQWVFSTNQVLTHRDQFKMGRIDAGAYAAEVVNN